ncbi:TPA: hypothetical protein VDT85_000450 [Pseudomonas aeruginosa]|uniref:hypothetical protein n=1 Tax=Pseudomonas aeruginosa TaxID=287 RepID=UPI000CF613CC|nr:hypothetical protein [Pseudomonas aeruginosa]MBI7365432.1 hypothetical protein [Pseudomonas aeruginosa]PQM13531.1 hypothetical protein C5F85_06310 [Pseudomonas aeruginosa]TEE67287.1 hypothetical protein IPC1499_07400 [Pseudomonas aeruginosa]HEP8135852.1 hypothetical protein [Pseudomonas aeruginosa]HEP8350019.1 hypothetical protein [Pseudomonas aeruginosa]
MTESKICTCPSGNGSLRHPCPAHPESVELTGVAAKLTFINGRPAMCGCQVEYSSGGGEYSDVIYVTLCAKHSGSAILDLVATNRIALTPEYEGQWHADLYLDREIPLAKAEGATPAEAVLALMSAERIDPEQESVEQAGGDERAAFFKHLIGRHPAHETEIVRVVEHNHAAWKAWQARAALAQPSPASDLDPFNLAPHAEAFNEAPAEALKSDQAEVERPEVVAWRYGSSGGILSDKACLDEWKSGGEYQSLMTVAQHERIVKAWIERWKAYIELSAKIAAQRDAADARLHEVATACATAEQERDAALARVAELERGKVYVEARRCDECQHGGINDSATGVAACHECDWAGPEPEEDKCPGCQRENCMAAACPQCGARYVLVASEEIAAPVAQAQQLHDLDKQCRDDVARALGLRPSKERGFAWSYLLASIKSCVKASEDAAQAQHSVPERLELTDDLKNILGRPNFTCTHLAQALRQIGFVIDRKAEAEQAACLHWMLNHYLANGANWKVHAEAELKAAAPGKEVGHE